MPVTNFPTDIPDFDNNATNSTAPTTGNPSTLVIADDGWAVNDELASSNANILGGNYPNQCR